MTRDLLVLILGGFPVWAAVALYAAVKVAERPRKEKPVCGMQWAFSEAPLIERPEWSERR